MTGEDPIFLVDHKNNIATENRWDNLRPATSENNNRNRLKPSTNTTGYKGASVFGHRFRATICVGGQRKHLGLFDTAIEAHAVYCAAAREHFGEFWNAG
jgi:hypothetical protein